MKNFTISLYAFHLRNRLTDAPGKVAPGAETLWENLAELGKASLPLPELKNLRSHLICYDENGEYNSAPELQRSTEWLTETGSLDLGSFETELGYKIEGSLEAFRLNDTYFADLTLYPESVDIAIEPSQLQQLQFQHLLPTKIYSSLGQTIWIYGEIEKPDDECKSLAESYALALLEGSKFAGNLRLINGGNVFGSLFFEYEAADPDNSRDLAKNCHLLVLIDNSGDPTIEAFSASYEWFRNLLWYRHKIIYVYQQSRELYQSCRQIYSELEAEIKKFSRSDREDRKRLKYLKNLLNNLPEKYLEYSRCLRDLQTQLTGLNTNAENYDIAIKKIIEIGGEESELWQKLTKNIVLWQKQIQTDLEYLEPGKELFDRILETARGIAEIEQAESDRSLEKTIQILGVALGVGGIFVTCYVEYADVPFVFKPSGKLNTIHPLVSSIFWTLLFACFAGVMTWWFARDRPSS